MIPSNFHTHSTYCDGNDTPEQTILTAIEHGSQAIGFSGHSYTYFDVRYCMTPKGTADYFREVTALKEKYKDKIAVYVGLEQDYYAEEPEFDYDYIIGSVHYVCKNGVYIPIDSNERILTKAVDAFYGGDFYSFIEDYYDLEGKVYEKTHCNIIAHFDLIMKFNEDGHLFDTANPRYRKAANEALDKLMKTPAVFEENYGAVARGSRTTPYPEPWILERIIKEKGSFIRSSDCHDRNNLYLGLKEVSEPEANLIFS